MFRQITNQAKIREIRIKFASFVFKKSSAYLPLICRRVKGQNF